jgi:hypothetical protein
MMRRPGDDPGRRLRPAPISSLFEIGFRILRRHWAVLLGVAVLIGLPGTLLGAVASIPFGEAIARTLPDGTTRSTVTLTDAEVRELLDTALLAMGGAIVAGVLSALAAVGFAWVVARDYHARPVSLGDSVGRALGRALPALALALLTTLAVLGIVLLGVGAAAVLLGLLAPEGAAGGGLGPFLAIVAGVVAFLAFVVVSVRLALGPSIVAVEDVSALTAIRRSWHLTGDHIWRTFGAIVLLFLIVAVLGAVLEQLLAIVLVDLIASGMGLELAGSVLVSTIVGVLFLPVTSVVLTVYLYDQMVRRDGWDVPPPTA